MTILQSPRTGKALKLLGTEEAKAIVKSKGLEVKVPKPQESSGGYDYKADQEKREREQRQFNLVIDQVLGGVVAGAEKDDAPGFLGLVAQVLSFHYDLGLEDVARRRGLESLDDGAFKKWVSKLSPDTLRGLVLELALDSIQVRSRYSWEENRDLFEAVCKRVPASTRRRSKPRSRNRLLPRRRRRRLRRKRRRSRRPRAKQTPVDTCKVCGCTDDDPCEDGCSWVEDLHTLCSACVEAEPGDKPEPKKSKRRSLAVPPAPARCRSGTTSGTSRARGRSTPS